MLANYSPINGSLVLLVPWSRNMLARLISVYQLAANAFICTRPIWYRHGSSVIHFLSVSINWTAGGGGLQPLLACIITVYTSNAESMCLSQINSRLDTFISIYLSTALASIIRPFGAVRWRWLTDWLTDKRTDWQPVHNIRCDVRRPVQRVDSRNDRSQDRPLACL